jgi:large repetitive protein
LVPGSSWVRVRRFALALLLSGIALPALAQADLVLQVADTPDPVVAGAVVSYTNRITNNGPNQATGITLVNTIPLGTSLASITAPPGVTCTLTTPPRTYTCTGFAPLGLVGELDVVFAVRPDNAADITGQGNVITNTSSATAVQADPTPGNNTNRTEQTTVTVGADLSVTKATVGTGPFIAGAVLSYTISASNAGPFPADGTIRAIETLPAGSTYAGAANYTENGWTCTHNGGTPGVLTCTRPGPLAAGATTPTFSVQIRPQVDGNITNGVNISSTVTPDPNGANDNFNLTTPIVPGADLRITKTGTPNPVAQGSPVSWTLNTSNNGPSPSGTITVTDTVPAGLTFIGGSITAPGWTCNFAAPTLTCTRPGPVNPGALPAISYQTSATAPGTQTNNASISGPTGDPDPGNNTAAQGVNVPAAGTDLSMSKTGPGSIIVGVPFNFILRATNNGPSTTDGIVRVTDTLAANLSFVSVTAAAPWTCTFTAPTLTCEHPAGVVGSPATALPDITLRVTAIDTATISNTASVAKIGGTLTDPNAGNNDSTFNNGGAAPQNNNMSTSKAVLVPVPPTAVVAPGTTVRYRITPRANGNVAIAAGATITVTDTVPASLATVNVVSAVGWTCNFAAPTLTCTRVLGAAFGPGADFPVIEYTAVVQAAGVGPDAIVNNACTAVTGSGVAGTTGCAAATLNRTNTSANLRIQKTDSGTTQWGAILTYTLRVDNLGPDAATNVSVTDDLLNATFIDATVAPAGPTCTFNSGTGRLTCPLGTIASGAPQTVITVRIRPRDNGPYPATRPNTANVISPDVGDSDLTNNEATINTTINAGADLQLAKVSNPPGVVQGGRPLDYTLTLGNNIGFPGAVASGQVRVIDTLPAQVTFDSIQSVSGGGSCVPSGAPVTTVTCTWPSIAANNQQTAVIRVFPVNNGTGNIVITNTAVAEVVTGPADPNAANDSATSVNTISPASADLVLNKTVTPDPVAQGQQNTFTVRVTNNGPSRASNGVVLDALPPAAGIFAFVPGSITTTQGTCSFNAGLNRINCNFGDINSGDQITVTYRLQANGLGTETNTATVSSDTPDPNAANNTVNRDATSRVGADLAITKTATPRVAVGANATWTLQVSNNGPGAARAVTVTDTLPAGFTFVSGTFTGVTGAGNCSAAGQVVTCAIPSAAGNEIPVGANQVTVTIVATATAGAAQNVTNSASVQSGFNPDTVPGNNTASAPTVVVRPLTGVKVFNPNPAPAGGVSQITITVNNSNSFAVTGTAFTDNLPATPGQMVVAAAPGASTTCAGGTVTAVAGATSFTLSGATVPANSSCVVTVNVTPPVVGAYTNTIPAGGITSTGEPLANSQAPFAAPLTAQTPTTLSIGKVAGAAQFTAGASASYTITVGNTGAFPTAGTITVTDTLPVGLTFVSATGTGWGCGAVGQLVTCTSTTVIAAGGSGNAITLNVNVGAAAVPSVSNTAQAAGGGANNTPTSTVVTPVRPAADLAVAKAVSDPNPPPGVPFNYVLTVTNAGPSTGTGVTVSDPLPLGTAFVSVVAISQGTYNAGTGVWTVGAVASGASAQLTLSVIRASTPPTITNTATVSGTEFDPNTTNNTAQVTVPQGTSDLRLTKTVSNATPAVGTNVTFAVTLINFGPQTATNVRVGDRLPLGYTFVSAAPSQGTFDAASGVWTVGTVNNGAIAELSIVATVRSVGPYLNVAQVTASDQSDPNSTPNNYSPSRPLENDEATATVAPTPVADLSIVKSGPANVAPGGALVYTIVVTNLGPSAANGAVFTDPIPPGGLITSALCGSAGGGAVCGAVTVTGQNVSSTITTLPAGGTVTFTITANAPTSGTLVNRAQVVTPAGVDDPTDPGRVGAGNNSSTVTTRIQTVSVLKTVVDDNGPQLVPGDTITWTISITNPAGETLINARLVDSIPANTTYVAGTTTLNGAAVADIGALPPFLGGGLLVNTPGQPAGTLTVAGAPAVITFRTRVNAGVIPGTALQNQAVLNATGQGSGQPVSQLSDDPTTPASPDATRIFTGGGAALDSTKTVVDDNGGTLLVGETITYTITLTNRGTVAVTNARISDPMPVNAAYLAGSIRYTPPAGAEAALTDAADADAGNFGVTAANTVTVNVGTLAPGQSVTVRFRATATGGPVISNQAVTTSDQLPPVRSDGDGNPANGAQPTEIVVGDTALLRQTKSVADVNGGAVQQGDVLEYTILTRNIGAAAATNVIVTDAVPPASTVYVAGSTSSNGVTVPDVAGVSQLVAGVGIGTLLPGQTHVLRFRVTINAGAPSGTVIDNQSFYVADGAGGGEGPLRGRSDSDLDDGIESGNSPGNPNDDDPTRVVIGGAPGSASVSGLVYLDLNSNRTFEAPDEVQPGWIVELLRNGAVVGTTTTDAAGAYTFRGVPPGPGYQIRFRNPITGVVYGRAQSTEPGVSLADGTIRNLTLAQGANVSNQNLPLDPSGVIYNAVTRQPVGGVRVFIDGPPGFDPNIHLLPGQQGQVTANGGATAGMYRFDINFAGGAPLGVYTLRFDTPPGYLSALPGTPSTLLPPAPSSAGCVALNCLQVPNAPPDPFLVQPNFGPPTGGAATTYFVRFNFTGLGNANVIHNHIPLDPVLGGALVVTKTTPRPNASRGDLVPYTITATNTLSATLPGINMVDTIPPGFRYRVGSATVDGVPLEPQVAGRVLTWPNLTFNPGQRRVFRMVLVIGAGVQEGEYVNQVVALNNATGFAASNVATALVRIVPDPTFDCSDLIGKVWNDRNANGIQDPDEPGIPNVRLATARGLLVTTDAEGRYHIVCADVPNEERGANFVLKIDERTLPAGFRMTTENPGLVRMTRGRLAQLNFGAAILRVVRVDVSAQAFDGSTATLLPEWQSRFDELPARLRERTSVVRIAYQVSAAVEGDAARARERVRELSDLMRKLWARQNCCYALTVEEEIVGGAR